MKKNILFYKLEDDQDNPDLKHIKLYDYKGFLIAEIVHIANWIATPTQDIEFWLSEQNDKKVYEIKNMDHVEIKHKPIEVYLKCIKPCQSTTLLETDNIYEGVLYDDNGQIEVNVNKMRGKYFFDMKYFQIIGTK